MKAKALAFDNEMFPYQITFVDCDSSPAAYQKIETHLAKLNKMFGRITSCEVMVRIPHKHNGQGRFFHIHVRLEVPGRQLVVSREPQVKKSHTDIYVAIHEAFEKLTRQLETYVRQQRSA